MRRYADPGGRRTLVLAPILALCGLGGGEPTPVSGRGDSVLGDTLPYRQVLRATVYRAGPNGPTELDESFTWILTPTGVGEAGRTLQYSVPPATGGMGSARATEIHPLYRHRAGFIPEPPRTPEVGLEWPWDEVVSGSWRGVDHRIERSGTLRVVGDTLLDGVRHLVVESRLQLRLDAWGAGGDDPRASAGTSLTGRERGRWVITTDARVVRGERAGELRGVAAELSMREPVEHPIRRTWRSVVTPASEHR